MALAHKIASTGIYETVSPRIDKTENLLLKDNCHGVMDWIQCDDNTTRAPALNCLLKFEQRKEGTEEGWENAEKKTTVIMLIPLSLQLRPKVG